VVQDPVHARQHVSRDVLVLLRLLEGLRGRAFDADEDHPEPRGGHALHQGRVLGQVERGLGVELEGPAVLALPALNVGEKVAHGLLLSDEVVFDEEDHPPESGGANRLQFAHDLLGILGARIAAEQPRDVAEFAEKGAAPREL
jgi:hypothetical protein